MVIERALEKLRQATAAKSAGGHASSARSAEPVRHRATPAAAATEPPPVFAQLECDRDAAILHRVLLPGTPLTANDRVAAAYRIIRTRLLHTIRSNNLKSVAITSPGPGEGKTVTSINLALSLARDPTSSVFLLDLDMRNPSVCRYLGVRPARELISFFTGNSAAAEVLFSIGPGNLAVAGNVAGTDLASELLSSGQLEAMLAYITSVSADAIVLLDLPPVLVTDEALLVAPRVDATLLVVSEGRTRRDSLARAVSVLAEFPSAGVILNCSNEANERSGYYYNYK
jgi:capsular exopolysaccharide synthesis family protein